MSREFSSSRVSIRHSEHVYNQALFRKFPYDVAHSAPSTKRPVPEEKMCQDRWQVKREDVVGFLIVLFRNHCGPCIELTILKFDAAALYKQCNR